MRWAGSSFARDERVLGTSGVTTVPDHFSALTNQLLCIFVLCNERCIESSAQRHCASVRCWIQGRGKGCWGCGWMILDLLPGGLGKQIWPAYPAVCRLGEAGKLWARSF